MRTQPLAERLYQALLGMRLLHPIMRRRARDVLRKSELHLHLPAQGRVLDLGCGSGHIAEAVTRHTPRLRCLSVDPMWLPSARMRARLAEQGASAVQADGAHLPFPNASFDGAWAAFVLHHMMPDRQDAVLNEVARVLRPKGVFVLIEDTPSNPDEAAVTLHADRRLNFEDASAPHHYRSPQEWQAALAACGFAISRVIPFTKLFPQVSRDVVRHTAFVCHR